LFLVCQEHGTRRCYRSEERPSFQVSLTFFLVVVMQLLSLSLSLSLYLSLYLSLCVCVCVSQRVGKKGVIFACLRALWKDPGILFTYENRSKFQLNDSAKYFFDRCSAFPSPFSLTLLTSLSSSHFSLLSSSRFSPFSPFALLTSLIPSLFICCFPLDLM